MRKIITALAFSAIVTSAWGDATETMDAKSAVDFVLSSCLPAMDDLANVETIARENNWFHLPTTVLDSKYTTPHSRWRANGIFVTTWIFKADNVPNCFIGFAPFKKVNRDDFFATLSASLQFKLTSDKAHPSTITSPSGFRQEFYDITGERALNMLLGSKDNDTLSVSIWRKAPKIEP